MEGVAKNDFSWKSFLKNFGLEFSVFGMPWERFSGFLSLENRFENDFFLVKNRILRPGSGYADPWVFGPSKNKRIG